MLNLFNNSGSFGLLDFCEGNHQLKLDYHTEQSDSQKWQSGMVFIKIS